MVLTSKLERRSGPDAAMSSPLRVRKCRLYPFGVHDDLRTALELMDIRVDRTRMLADAANKTWVARAGTNRVVVRRSEARRALDEVRWELDVMDAMRVFGWPVSQI